MKKNSCTSSGSITPRALIALCFVFTGTLFALVALRAGPIDRSSSWLGHLVASLGSNVDSQASPTLSTAKGGGAMAASKITGEPTEAQAPSAADATTAYRGPHNDLRPVAPIRTGDLRQMPAIPPRLAPTRIEREPIRPQPPTDRPTGTVAQAYAGSPLSAPTSGTVFEGVGTGIPGFSPIFNPPDTNGRVGATQYVQWNNASFAVFSKSGTLLYGPVAGNTLFQSLGGACASHNDGDPAVAYDILTGRWILSQFVVGASPDFSHQCVAVSATGDALGSYYLYDFVTDPANFVDYPKIGVWPDGYYMTGHVFNAAGTAFLAGRVFVFERDKMLK